MTKTSSTTASSASKAGLDRIAPVDGDIPVENLLQNLGVGDQTLAHGDGALEQASHVRLVRVLGADEIHRNGGVAEDHPASRARYPRSISANILLDLPGRERVTRRRAYALQLLVGVAEGLAPARRTQGLPHPLGHGHASSPRDAPNLAQLCLVQQHLKPLAHMTEPIRLMYLSRRRTLSGFGPRASCERSALTVRAGDAGWRSSSRRRGLRGRPVPPGSGGRPRGRPQSSPSTVGPGPS